MRQTHIIAKLVLGLCAVIACGSAAGAGPMGTTFVYQGHYDIQGQPANGLFDLAFSLCSGPDGPNVLERVVLEDVQVVDGAFQVELDFTGLVWDGQERWMQVEARPAQSTDPLAFVLTGPRQPIRPVPYALYAQQSGGPWTISGNDLYTLAPGGVGIGTMAPGAPLDVERLNPGALQVAALLTNPSDQQGTAVALDLAVGTSLPTSWRIAASGSLMQIGNAVAASPALTITGTQWVGIGTTDPKQRLHVAGLARFDLGGGSMELSTPGGWPGIITFSPNGHRRDIIMDDGTLRLLTSASSSSAGADNGITIDEQGSVGIGTYYPAFMLHVNGSAGKPGGGSWASASDIRLKKNIRDMDEPLETLLRLRGVTFEYKDPQKIHELPGVQMGMIAQEVEQVFPQWVDTTPEGTKTVTYRGFEALTVEALRELRQQKDAEIAELKRTIADLTAKTDRLEALVTRLERMQQTIVASQPPMP
jgi:hypothetical protein